MEIKPGILKVTFHMGPFISLPLRLNPCNSIPPHDLKDPKYIVHMASEQENSPIYPYFCFLWILLKLSRKHHTKNNCWYPSTNSEAIKRNEQHVILDMCSAKIGVLISYEGAAPGDHHDSSDLLHIRDIFGGRVTPPL